MVRGERDPNLPRREGEPAYADLLGVLESDPATAQAYEALLSSLALVNSSRPPKTMLVTSTRPEEGKTTVTSILALTMIRAGRKVLVLDADLRKPQIHEVFGLKNVRGVADLWQGKLSVEDVTQVVQVTTGAPENKRALSVITSGNGPSTSLPSTVSPSLTQAIQHSATQYDAVLLDSPPVLSVNDSLLLAAMVDGVILVLDAGVVTEKDAARAQARLERAGGHIVGVVLNRFDEELAGPGLHPYHGYYTSHMK